MGYPAGLWGEPEVRLHPVLNLFVRCHVSTLPFLMPYEARNLWQLSPSHPEYSGGPALLKLPVKLIPLLGSYLSIYNCALDAPVAKCIPYCLYPPASIEQVGCYTVPEHVDMALLRGDSRLLGISFEPPVHCKPGYVTVPALEHPDVLPPPEEIPQGPQDIRIKRIFSRIPSF